MTYEFTANKFEADESQRFLGFADEQHYLWMQPDDEEEVAPSVDAANVWIEIHDQQFGGCGGIQRVILKRNVLAVSLTPAKVKKMGLHNEITVTFDVAEDEFQRIWAVLQVVMRGSEPLVEILP